MGEATLEQSTRPGLEAGLPQASQSTKKPGPRLQALDIARHRAVLRTGAGILLLVAAGVLEARASVPPGVWVFLYVLSYVSLGWEAARGAVRNLAKGKINVDQLMLLAAAGAAVLSEWREGAILLLLFSLSETLQAYVLGRNRRSIEALLRLQPDTVTLRRDSGDESIPLSSLRKGDRILVRPGERIGADGVVREGHTSVDQSPVTGESIPVEKTAGDLVYAASLNQTGAIEVDVTREVADSTLAQIVRLVERVQKDKAATQHISDWFGSRYTIAVLVVAAVGFVVPLLLGEAVHTAFYRSMTLLVVGSPCAIVISIPAAILAAIAGAARRGILIKGGIHLEEAAGLQAIALDKTGTLTHGRPSIVALRAAPGVDPQDVLKIAAAVESAAEHPLAAPILAEAAKRNLSVPSATNVQALVGLGVRAELDGRPYAVGKPAIARSMAAEIPANLLWATEQDAANGWTIVYLVDSNRVIGMISLVDGLRPGARRAIARLKELGIRHLVMLTGDHKGVASAIAAGLGIPHRADLKPDDKLKEIESLRSEWKSIAMVGDGINDAPALAAANLGISLSSTGTDVALETSDVVLMGGDLRLVPLTIEIARRARSVINQNLLIAFGAMICLLLATFLGSLRLPLAVVGHEGSTLLVILNGLRLLAAPRLVPLETADVEPDNVPSPELIAS
jgi:Cd2+/Zn2+-exporting ATPase